MISFLRGSIAAKGKNFVDLHIGGIGYRVFAPLSVLDAVRDGQEVTLYTHQYVREDALELYGFLDTNARQLFELLIDVSGVGPKTALNVLSLASAKDVERAIISGDPSLLTKVSGIGKKTAERILLELRGKLGVDDGAMRGRDEHGGGGAVVDALIGLGYSAAEARSAAQKALRTLQEKTKNPPTMEALVKEALRNI